MKDFTNWLAQQGAHPPLRELMRVLLAMEQAGLLLSGGYQRSERVLGQIFWSVNEKPVLPQNLVWLADVFGAEVISPAYNSATVLITGTDASGREVGPGSGLVLDPWHVVTNRHVVEKMETDIRIVAPELPSALGWPARPEMVIPIHKSQLHFEKRDPEAFDPTGDLDVDVAVIQLAPLPSHPRLWPVWGLTFRNPRWGDTTYVFGYPRAQFTTTGDITRYSGRAVNPAEDARELKVESSEVAHPEQVISHPPDRSKVFLYSATTRPCGEAL